MTDDPNKHASEDANQAAHRIVQQATAEKAHAAMGEKEDRCSYLWNGKRCKLRTGHFVVHQFDV
jgi:hypothetical protein